MNFIEFTGMCHRAFALILCKKKMILSFLAITFCSLFIIFCMSLAFTAPSWIALSLYFLPIFITGMVLMGFGVVLIRSYHNGVKHKEVDLLSLFLRSWDAVFSAASAFLFVLISYLVLWMGLGVFSVLKELPFIGEVFACLFVFIPFLLNVALLLLAVFSVYAIFVMSPSLALKSALPQNFLQLAKDEFTNHVCSRVVLFVTALLPIMLSLILTVLAASMTLRMCAVTSGYLQVVMQWFFLLLPTAMLLSPSLVFFFNMAAESHVLVHKLNNASANKS